MRRRRSAHTRSHCRIVPPRSPAATPRLHRARHDLRTRSFPFPAASFCCRARAPSTHRRLSGPTGGPPLHGHDGAHPHSWPTGQPSGLPDSPMARLPRETCCTDRVHPPRATPIPGRPSSTHAVPIRPVYPLGLGHFGGWSRDACAAAWPDRHVRSGSGCPSFTTPAATGPAAEVSHLRSNHQRLVAHAGSGRARRRHGSSRPGRGPERP
jgi:hypothetical protein